MLSQLLLPVLRERFADRGLVEGTPPDPCAAFPGVHPGIRGVSIYDDGDELTVCVDDLTHGHFSEYTEGLSESEREHRIVESVVEFLSALFADEVVVWGQQHMGGWYRPGSGDAGRNTVIAIGGSGGEGPAQGFVWSGPYKQRHAETEFGGGGLGGVNVFDKVCASLAFALGVVFVLAGVAGLAFGCRAHFTLPPVLGVLPAFVGWGIVRAVYLAWRRYPQPPAERWPDGFRPLPGAGGPDAEPGAAADTAAR
ncbi:MAG: hypothetical protein C0501_31415 [Isosphaera sp.]|nr:hypothetical protein [Isosphaera sp.]